MTDYVKSIYNAIRLVENEYPELLTAVYMSKLTNNERAFILVYNQAGYSVFQLSEANRIFYRHNLEVIETYTTEPSYLSKSGATKEVWRQGDVLTYENISRACSAGL